MKKLSAGVLFLVASFYAIPTVAKLSDLVGVPPVAGQSGKYLTNDGTKTSWGTVSSGGGTWGSITGTLSNQTDLQSALDGKASLSGNNTLSGTNTFTPSNLSSNGIVAKPPASHTGKIFTVQNTSGTNYFYADGSTSPAFHVAGDMQFNNIPGGSLLGLSNTNYIQGINTLVNLQYFPNASTLQVVPSGSTGAIQYYNNTGFLGGAATHLALDPSTFKLTSSGTADNPSTPTSFAYAIEYGTDAGSFTTGYTANGSNKLYYLYEKKNDPITGDYFSASPAVLSFNDNNSQIVLTAASPSNSGVNNATGSVYQNQTFYYKLSMSGVYNGNTAVSNPANTTNASDFSGNFFTVLGIDSTGYSFPLGSTSTQVVAYRSLDNGSTYNSYKIVTLPFDDDGTGWTDEVVSGVTASEAPGSGSYLENSTTRDYQVYAVYVSSHGGRSVIQVGSTIAQAGFTDGNDGVTLYAGQVNWSAYPFPSDSTSRGYIVLRQVNGAGFNEGQIAAIDEFTTSFLDTDDSLWGSNSLPSPAVPPSQNNVQNFFQIHFTYDNITGNKGYKIKKSEDSGLTFVATDIAQDTTAFTDTGSLPWAASLTVTPTSAGPWGFEAATSQYAINSTGIIRSNNKWNLATDIWPNDSKQYALVGHGSDEQAFWQSIYLPDLQGQVTMSQIPYGQQSSGNIMFSNGTSLASTFGVPIFDFGNVYQTLRVPTILSYSSGYQYGQNSNTPQWQLYGVNFNGSSNTSTLLYNLQGGPSYGVRLVIDGDRNNFLMQDTNGSTRPSDKAVLELKSTTRGLLPPRMTTIQRTAISSPDEGLMVYDLTLHQMCYYNGTLWVCN